jgi:hypothetical protein
MVWERFDVTSQVKAWITNPSGNWGFLIKFNDNDRRGIMVYSSESKETDKRPKLVINSDITGIVAKAGSVGPSPIKLSRAGNSLRLELPATSGWETATVFGLDGRKIAGVRMQKNKVVYRIDGSFAGGAFIVRLHSSSSEMVKMFIPAD